MLEDNPGNRLYLRLVETALEDSIVTDDEAAILRILSHALGVQPSDTSLCISIAKGDEQSPFDKDESLLEMPMGSVSTYQSALIAALDDEVITEDEWALLDHLRQLLGIQPDQHGMIEEAIHAMSDVDEEGRKRLERLERFMTVCPFA